MRADLMRDGRPTNANCLLSGDHVMSDSAPIHSLTLRGVPPVLGKTYKSKSLRSASSRALLYGNLESESRSKSTTESARRRASAMNAIHLPSGETSGERCE